LARKIAKSPLIEKALAEGKAGWSKAYRMVKLADATDEVLSLESAMPLSVRELDRRLRKNLARLRARLRRVRRSRPLSVCAGEGGTAL
jgi:hypothetical protein